MTFAERPLIDRASRGAKIGLAVASVLSLWAAIAYALKDAQQTAAIGITLREVVAAYLLGGFFGGVFAGAMISLMRWSVGAFLLGYIANLPTCLIIAAFVAADGSLAAKITIGMIIACIGGALALLIRSDPWPGLM